MCLMCLMGLKGLKGLKGLMRPQGKLKGSRPAPRCDYPDPPPQEYSCKV